MKNFKLIFLGLLLTIILAGCDEYAVVEYSEEDFEQALNNGENLEGSTVEITIHHIAPASAFGHNLQAGEHLNFVSPGNPGYEVGDTVILKVDKIASTFGSYIITYR